MWGFVLFSVSYITRTYLQELQFWGAEGSSLLAMSYFFGFLLSLIFFPLKQIKLLQLR